MTQTNFVQIREDADFGDQVSNSNMFFAHHADLLGVLGFEVRKK